MSILKKLWILATLVFAFSSCINDDTFGDDYEDYTALVCWSEPDMTVAPLKSDHMPTTPMIFRMGEKYSFCYRLFKPKGYEESDQRLPLIIYLHGLDQRGDDNLAQMNYAVYYFMRYPQYQAFAVYPQCPVDAYWALSKWPTNFNPSKMELNPENCYMDYGLRQLIADLENTYPIDSNRI